jgi:hypothetical protein
MSQSLNGKTVVLSRVPIASSILDVYQRVQDEETGAKWKLVVAYIEAKRLHIGTTTMNDMATVPDKRYYSKRKEKFVKHFEEVLQLAKKNDGISLPRNNAKTRVLANFLDNQKRRKYLPNDEREMLEALKPYGYDIDARIDKDREDSWETRFKELVDYKERVGHLRVSKSDPTTRKLSRWVNQQRQNEKDNKLSEGQKQRLLSIGFVFICTCGNGKKKRFTDDQEITWNKMFGNLCKYKEEQGHCDVPFTYENDPELARWVSVQRIVFRLGKMDQSRRQRLEDIGFTWSLKKPATSPTSSNV